MSAVEFDLWGHTYRQEIGMAPPRSLQLQTILRAHAAGHELRPVDLVMSASA